MYRLIHISFPFFTGIFLLLISFSGFTQLTVSPVYSDHMVIQQQSKSPIWGSCDCKVIKIETGWGASISAMVNDNKWIAHMETPVYGGPYEIRVSSENETKIFKDVLIGEVWFASGQSNMQWTFSERINDKEQTIKNSNNPSIRMFNVPNDLSGSLLSKSSWVIANPENLKHFSAVGYFFASNLNASLKIPIGIINSSWGGTRIEAWMSADTLQHFSSTQKEVNQIIRVGSYKKLSDLNAIEENTTRINNETYLKESAYNIPAPLNDSALWNKIQLNDSEFIKTDFDDNHWAIFKPIEKERDWSSYSIAFEDIYSMNEIAQGGVIWFRRYFELDDIQNDIYIEYDGIDDLDWTYVNGYKIGETLQCCGKRRYLVPRAILKTNGNVLAVRVVDFKGPGGFMGNVKLQTKDKYINLSSGTWKFKHHAFYLHPTLQLHSYNHQDLLSNYQELSTNLRTSNSIDDPNAAGILYEKMIQPIIPFQIKGIIWYQGESNVQNHKDYVELFPGLIQNWREKWQKDLPFYYVQIAPYQYSDEQSSQSLREAQRNTLKVANTGMVVTLDIGEEKDIHPANKNEVGSRLSKLALKYTYGYKKIVASGPNIIEAKIKQSFIDLYFSKIGGKLAAKNVLSGFEVAGVNGTYKPAQAEIFKNRIRLSQYDITNPVSVRYGWKNYFDATLFNKGGWPSSSFEINLK